MSQDRIQAEPLQLRSLYKYYKLMDRGCSATRINKKNYSSDYRHIIPVSCKFHGYSIEYCVMLLKVKYSLLVALKIYLLLLKLL